MTESPQPETLRSHITHLLDEQKYDEALPILFDLSEKNPSDPELHMYRLLVLRILVLRWNLSRTAAGAATDSCTITKRILKSLTSAVRVPDTAKLIRSLNQIRRAAEAAFSKRRTKLGMTAAAGTALLALYIVEGSNIAILAPSTLLSSTHASHSTVSGLAAKTYNSRVAEEDERQIPLPPEDEERNFSPVISETSQVLPNEHSQGATEKKLTLSGTDAAKATPQVNASKFVAKREPSKAVLNVESSTEVPAKEKHVHKTPSEILGYYRSRWAIPIRKSASFRAAIVQQIDSGISLSVLEFVGSWAKVEFGPERVTGFVRREFLTSVMEIQSNVADSSPSAEISDGLSS